MPRGTSLDFAFRDALEVPEFVSNELAGEGPRTGPCYDLCRQRVWRLSHQLGPANSPVLAGLVRLGP